MNKKDSDQDLKLTASGAEVKKDDSSLDDLLDDALEDFSKPVLQKQNESASNAVKNEASADGDSTTAWTEEFIKQAAQNFESTMKCVIDQQKSASKEEGADTKSSENLQLDYGEISAEFAKFAETAAKAATEATSDQDFTQCLAQTMQQMNQNKEDAQTAPSAADLEKMFDQFGLGGGGGGGGIGDEMGGLFPLMQSMLENILSKEVLYEPIKEIVTKYPDWLADNRSQLPEDEFERYSKQYSIMKQVIEKYESELETDSDEAKSKNFESILKLMQNIQEYGHPPTDLVGDQGNPLMSFDQAGNPQLPDLSSILGSAGFPSFGSPETDTANPTQESANGAAGPEQCSLM